MNSATLVRTHGQGQTNKMPITVVGDVEVFCCLSVLRCAAIEDCSGALLPTINRKKLKSHSWQAADQSE